MIILYKILPALFLPVGLAICLIVAGLIFRRRALCWTGVGILWLSSLPIVGNSAMRAAENWQGRRPISEIRPADAIVVLSNRPVQPPGDPSAVEWSEDVDRFDGGLGLYKAGKSTKLVLTGGWLPWWGAAPSADKILVDLAVKSGVPRDRVLTTGKVMNTAAEAQEVARLLSRDRGVTAKPTIILVTSAFHMRRSQFLFERAGLRVIPFPVDFRVPEGSRFTALDLVPSAGALRNTETAMRELYGYLYVRISSWLGITPLGFSAL